MRYFDKKFWKMFSGFVTIIAVSAIIIFTTRIYQEKQLEKQAATASAISSQQ